MLLADFGRSPLIEKQFSFQKQCTVAIAKKERKTTAYKIMQLYQAFDGRGKFSWFC